MSGKGFKEGTHERLHMLKERNHREMAREKIAKGEMADMGMRGNSQSVTQEQGWNQEWKISEFGTQVKD